MPSHKHREKRILQSTKRQERNTKVKSKIKTLSKKVKSVAAESDASKLNEVLRDATSTIDSAATKGIIHKKAASRRVSRLAKLANKTSPSE